MTPDPDPCSGDPLRRPLHELALFGAAPAFPEPLHVGRPNVCNRVRLFERLNEMLDRRWLSNDGPFVQELEQQIADLVGVRHCLTVCNGTVALELAVRACGLTGEVIVPSFTFIATAHALKWHGVTPVFCDIDVVTHNLDPRKVEALITPRTTGVVGVHVWGRACEVEALTELTRKHGLTLLLDAAHAFAGSHRGKMVGTFGEAEVFSFHATKFFNTLEGGAVVTNNDDLAARVRLMRNFGFSGGLVHLIGTNAKMNEASAAMGLTMLESLDDLIEVNKTNYHRYQACLAGVPGLKMVAYDEAERCNYQYIVLEIDRDAAGVTADAMAEALRAENVLARRYFHPACHQMEPYRSLDPEAGERLPATERIADRVLSLPTGTSIGPAEIGTISDIIRTVVAHGGAVAERLSHASVIPESTTPVDLGELAKRSHT